MHHHEATPSRPSQDPTQRRALPERRPEPTETPGWAHHDFLVRNQRPDLTYPEPNPPQPIAYNQD